MYFLAFLLNLRIIKVLIILPFLYAVSSELLERDV
jgi:hypothetical protein